MSIDRTRRSFDLARHSSTAAILVLLVISAGAFLVTRQLNGHTAFLIVNQDMILAPLFALACLIRARAASLTEAQATGVSERHILLMCMGGTLALGWSGHYTVLRGLDLTRDELMVLFDAGIFRDLKLAAPIPTEWQPLANALNRKFMLPIGSAEFWVSAYLPVNAALHAMMGAVIDDDLTAPLCVAAGAFFLWRIARLLWPGDRGATLAALALYAGSSQILITGMTKYSMSAHMAFNLCWLWLFLRNTRKSHILAMLVAFFATGLHQPIFHPMFALPFVLLLAARREWKWFGSYGLAYALIGAFWLAWPVMMARLGTGPMTPISEAETVTHLERLLVAYRDLNLHSLWLTSANLLRFVTWQHPLLLVLAVYGVMACWRSEPLVGALAASLALPVLVLWVVLPWQGNGWGYRYLHPAIGSAMLLGGWGWRSLSQQGLSIRRPFLWTTAAAILVLFPLHSMMVFQSTRGFARTEKAIAQLDADLVIIDGRESEFIFNRHDLSNRPIRLVAQDIPLSQMATLCRGRTVVFVDSEPPRPVSHWHKSLKTAAAASECETKTITVWIGLLQSWDGSFDMR